MLPVQTAVTAASSPKRSSRTTNEAHAIAASGSISHRFSLVSPRSPATMKATTSTAAIQSLRVASRRIRNSSSSPRQARVVSYWEPDHHAQQDPRGQQRVEGEKLRRPLGLAEPHHERTHEHAQQREAGPEAQADQDVATDHRVAKPPASTRVQDIASTGRSRRA